MLASIFRKWLPMVAICCTLQACALDRGGYRAAPSLMPGTTRCMKRPGFWISRHPFPDRLILSGEQIDRFNQHLEQGLRVVNPIPGPASPYPGARLRSTLEERLNRLCRQTLYLADGCRATRAFYVAMGNRMDLQGIRDRIQPEFGLIVRYADQRVLPSMEGLFSSPGQNRLDVLQNSGLDIGTPLEILHESGDGEWAYGVSPLSAGWVQRHKVARCSRRRLGQFLRPLHLAVICKAKGDLFLNPSLTRFHDYVRMGVRLPLLHTNSKVAQVSIPWRRRDGTLSEKAAYLRKAAVHRGFFPYTARNIIRQSFELLNAPYGWGGMHGEQDCSRFVQQVFATVGIALPRNSQHQGRTGCLLGAFRDSSSMVERRHVLSQRAVGGITLLGMKGHIMLFLGTVGHQPYVIHAAFAYREPARWGDINRVVNRVVISDLSLGKGTRRGSLLERLKSVRMVSSPAGCRP